MTRLVWDNYFKRAFKKLIKKNLEVQVKITDVLILLAEDPFTPSLKSHKLTGILSGLWSCFVNRDDTIG